MIYKMRNKRLIITAFCSLAVLFGMERLYYRQNGGFKVSKLYSPLPEHHLLAREPVPPNIDALLEQTFRFVGSGGTCFVFLGEDGETILKLFKHQHLTLHSFFAHLTLPGILDGLRVGKLLSLEGNQRHKRMGFFFPSCALAYTELKEETGLIYLCLTPDSRKAREVTLIDAWGLSHTVRLDRTEFALQHRAEMLFSYLDTLIGRSLILEAKGAIDALVSQIQSRCAKGIGDRDPNLLINFGFFEGKAIECDIGSFYPDPELASPFTAAHELFFATFALQQWLKAKSPELFSYLLGKITEQKDQLLP